MSESTGIYARARVERLERERDAARRQLAEVRSMARNSHSGWVASSVLLEIVGNT